MSCYKKVQLSTLVSTHRSQQRKKTITKLSFSFQQNTMASIKIVALIMLVVVIALADAYPRLVVLDDGQIEAPQHVRVSRDEKVVAPATTNKVYNRGRVGSVYTFVKTDPKANFKWGVRHRVGSQYGR